MAAIMIYTPYSDGLFYNAAGAEEPAKPEPVKKPSIFTAKNIFLGLGIIAIGVFVWKAKKGKK